MFYVGRRHSVCLPLLGFAILSCRAAGDGDPKHLRVSTQSERTSIQTTEAHITGATSIPDFIDEDGSRYVWQRTIGFEGASNTGQVLTDADAISAAKQTRIADMSVSELAGKLRSRLLRDGEEYLLDHDPVDLAERVLAAMRAGAHPPDTAGRQPNFDALKAQGIIPSGRTSPSPDFIIGSDDRISYDHAALSFPSNMSLLTESIACTATVIGERMAASAAHCYLYNGPPHFGTGYYIPYASNTAPTQQYGKFGQAQVYYPTGWNGVNAWQFDYAMVKFPPNTFSNWGWAGTSSTYGEGTPASMWGYPQDKPYPQLWLSQGIVTKYTSPNWYCHGFLAIRHNLDVIDGDSGAGLLRPDIYGTPSYLIGIQSTQWEVNGTPLANKAKAWDSDTYAYFSSSGVWP